jgi:hypothetical protein
MNFITFISPAITVLAWTIWGLVVFIVVFVVVNAVVVSSFRQACKAYYEYKLAMYDALHKQSQEDADEISSQFWEKMK